MIIFLKRLPLFLSLCFFAGCSNLEWPPSNQNNGSYNKISQSSLSNRKRIERLAVPSDGSVKVRPGDTLFILSKRYQVSARTIIEANQMLPPYRLLVGEELLIPKPKIHTITKGESLYKVSRKYGLDVYEIAKINSLQSPYRIYVGDKLVLPISDLSDSNRKPQITKPKSKINRITQSEPESDRSTISSTKALIKKRNKMGKSRILPKINKITRESFNKSPVIARQFIKIPKMKTTGRFKWPVQGKLLSNYGAKGDGLHNDGINIIAQKGDPVRAAGSGKVAYAGNELRGFGNLLLIKHPGGWVTAYAHNSRLLVKRGDRVKAGDVIAKVGSSGNVVLPQLHFEIRKGKRAINPLRHLKRLKADLKIFFNII